MTKCEIKRPLKPVVEPKANENQDEGIEDDLDNEEKVYDEEMGVQNDEDDEGTQEANNYETQEENLDFEKFLFRYTHPHVLKCFIMMLGEYSKNSDCEFLHLNLIFKISENFNQKKFHQITIFEKKLSQNFLFLRLNLKFISYILTRLSV